MIRGVLFDLDDTLFDHASCARTALRELRHAYAALQAPPFDELEGLHARLLEAIHARVMIGAIPLDAAREERFRQLLAACGEPAGADVARAAAQLYRESYQRSRRAVAGAACLLRHVRARAPVAIVSNNLLVEQQEKLAHCGLCGLFDALVVSEQAGVAKPDRGIFEQALTQIGVAAECAVMVGDSWAADIEGARAAGLRAVWFNPSDRSAVRTDAAIRILRSLEPVEQAMACIFEGWPPAGPSRERLLQVAGQCG